jgi:hypothetical protein
VVELSSRALGFRPDIPETKELWYYWRQRIYGEPGRAAVLLGTSRMQTDISLGTFERALDRPVVQLAITETGPIGVLCDLAEDARFKGVIICSLYVPLVHRSRWSDGLQYRVFAPANDVAYLESLCSLQLRSRLSLLSPRLSLSSLARGLAGFFGSGHFSGEPSVFALSFDRSLALYMEADDDNAKGLDSVHQFRDMAIPPFEQLRGDIDALNAVIRRLRSHGGDVVFVQLPSTGNRDSDEEIAFPKKDYWDPFARLIAARCIHFKDYPALREFRCPDGVHLSAGDRQRFTQALAKELLRGEAFGGAVEQN